MSLPYEEVLKNTDSDFVTFAEVEDAEASAVLLKKKINDEQEKLDGCKDLIYDTETKIKKIQDFIDTFDIDVVKEKNNESKKLVKTLWELKGLLKAENAELTAMEKSVKRLLEVPCGDSFPTCKFIKDSHRDKSKIEEKRIKVNRLETNLSDLTDSYKKIKKENYEEKIEKYNSIIQKKSELVTKISNNRVEIQSIQNKIENLKKEYETKKRRSEDLKRRFDGQDPESDVSGVSKLLSIKKKDLKINDENRIDKIRDIEGLRLAIENAEKSKKKFNELNTQLKVQDLFIQATSKRGIPVQIINLLLPKINKEISKILKGVVGFTVVLEADLESNAMDVFIDYGDSKRIIELASGMEKMISSLAIRVALINISSLPKSSMLIIDEGFGSLDETNLEACGRLLHSLKKSFKNILVISHIDQIKDIVDNTIDITKLGVDSHVQSI